MKTLSIIIPLYKSSRNIVQNFEKLVTSLNSLQLKEIEFICIEDGCPEKCSNKIDTSLSSNIKILKHDKNLGLGAVIRNGIKHASLEYICYLDLDLSYGIENVKQMIDLINDPKTVVIASKYKTKNNIPILRRIYKSLFTSFIQRIEKLNLSDLGSGLVIFSSEVSRKLNLISNGFAIHFELYCELKKNKCNFIEIGVDYKFEEGTISLRKHFFPTLIEVIKLSKKQK